MKKGMFLIGLLSGMVMALWLSGCVIITASPDPGTAIRKNPGDKILFKVTGPENTANTKCVWTIERNKVDRTYNNEVLCEGKNECEYEINPDSELTNKITITCSYMHWGYVKYCNKDVCHWVREWVTDDSRHWEVKINPNNAPVINGDYFAENNTDLQLLAGYTSIDGSLEIFGYSPLKNKDSVTTLECLENLTEINGSLQINENNWLNDLSGLENLTSVGGDLTVWDNDALTNLSALENITVCTDLIIAENDALTSLTGLENIASVNGNLQIYDNLKLCDLLAEDLRDQILAKGGVSGEVIVGSNKNCTTP